MINQERSTRGDGPGSYRHEAVLVAESLKDYTAAS